MKNILKTILIFFIIINIYSILNCNKVFASDIWQMGKDFLDTGADEISDGESIITKIARFLNGDTNSNNAFSRIIGFFWGIGLLVVMISTVILGIKYMMVSPDEKSRIKQATTPYAIGVIVIFGAVTIWKFLIEILENPLL